MDELWSQWARQYGTAHDREEKQRALIAEFMADKSGSVLELACGNGRILEGIRERNPDLILFAVDSNARMIEEAAIRVPGAKLVRAEASAAGAVFPGRQFDVVYAVNSLHNFRDCAEIDRALVTMKRLVAPGGYIAFDVRNALNPFISWPYAQHRRKGLHFYALNPFRIMGLFPAREFEVIERRAVGYDSLEEAGVAGRSIFYRIVYATYLRLTRNLLLSPYQLYIVRRRCQSRSP